VVGRKVNVKMIRNRSVPTCFLDFILKCEKIGFNGKNFEKEIWRIVPEI